MSEYWEERKHLKYYQHVRKLIEDSNGSSILDVGSSGTPVASWGTFLMRSSLNLWKVPDIEGIDSIVANFLTWEPDRPYDIVTCLKVLEHIVDEEVSDFAQKLLEVAQKKVIMSVPWHWPKGSCVHHEQDPVTMEKVVAWFGREPDSASTIIDNGLNRAVCVFEV
jgi:hypothetical protein